MSLADRLIKNSTIKLTSKILETTISKGEMIPTPLPMLNVALSGKVDGGLQSGILQIAGPSKHYKSKLALLLAGSYLNKYKDGVLLFYQNEFGMPESYWDGIDMDRVVLTPVTTVEELKRDMAKQIDKWQDGDRICVVVDSIGQLASTKEVDDAIEGKDTTDMTRAKAIASLSRIIVPHLTLKQIPVIFINHTYEEMSNTKKKIVSGGTKLYLASDDIWIMNRQQDKDQTTKELYGWNFDIVVEKSRTVKEQSKIPIMVQYNTGVNQWTGLFDMATQFDIIKDHGAWFSIDGRDKKFRRKDIEADAEFWLNVLKTTPLAENIRKFYQLDGAKQTPFDRTEIELAKVEDA